MKKNILLFLVALFWSFNTLAQNASKTPVKDMISFQISQKVNPIYDVNGKMIEGLVQVFFIISDTKKICVEDIIAENEILKQRLLKQLEEIYLEASQEDLNKSISVKIHFVQR